MNHTPEHSRHRTADKPPSSLYDGENFNRLDLDYDRDNDLIIAAFNNPDASPQYSARDLAAPVCGSQCHWGFHPPAHASSALTQDGPEPGSILAADNDSAHARARRFTADLSHPHRSKLIQSHLEFAYLANPGHIPVHSDCRRCRDVRNTWQDADGNPVNNPAVEFASRHPHDCQSLHIAIHHLSHDVLTAGEQIATQAIVQNDRPALAVGRALMEFSAAVYDDVTGDPHRAEAMLAPHFQEPGCVPDIYEHSDAQLRLDYVDAVANIAHRAHPDLSDHRANVANAIALNTAHRDALAYAVQICEHTGGIHCDKPVRPIIAATAAELICDQRSDVYRELLASLQAAAVHGDRRSIDQYREAFQKVDRIATYLLALNRALDDDEPDKALHGFTQSSEPIRREFLQLADSGANTNDLHHSASRSLIAPAAHDDPNDHRSIVNHALAENANQGINNQFNILHDLHPPDARYSGEHPSIRTIADRLALAHRIAYLINEASYDEIIANYHHTVPWFHPFDENE